MLGQHTTRGTSRQNPTAQPVRRLRAALAVAVIAGTGALGTTTGIARATPMPQPTPDSSQYVRPSEQVMREMRRAIVALYGPQPTSTAPDQPRCSPPALRRDRVSASPNAG